jgi:peptidoglycan/LPS O-acetylase OafA/YrhL
VKIDNDFRHAHVALAVGIAVMIVGSLIIGRNPTDAESQAVGWVTMGVAFAVLVCLHERDHRRRRRGE